MYRRELYTFLAVVEEGSFLKASKKCFLTPASVMHQIDNLEAALGVRLFRRTNQGVVLTPAGQSFYRDAQALLREGEQAVRRARDLDRAERSTIRVGTSILRPGRALVDLWSSLGDAPFKLELVPFDEAAGGTDAMLSALGGQLDCFVSPSASPRWKRAYNVLPLYRERSCIALPRTHPLAKKTSLDWPDLDGETLLLVQEGKSTELDRLRAELLRAHPGVHILDIPPICNMDAFNLCDRMGCLMELPASWADIHPALVTLPVNWDYQVEYGLLYAKEPSPTVAALIDWLRPRLPDLSNP